MASTRSLDIIPIVHSETDLGSLGVGTLAGDTIAHVRELWEQIRLWADTLDARPEGQPLRLYQDGLPVSPDGLVSEHRIAEDLANAGSLNFRIVLSLVERGAQLIGTEDPELLVREYELARAVRSAPDPRHADRARRLLAARDEFIARRIDQTLPLGARGLIFIGALHDVGAHLPPDIAQSFPLGCPKASLRRSVTHGASA